MSKDGNLESLLRRMAPRLHPDAFVYCTFPDFRVPTGINPLCTFREAEGLTAIVEKSEADRGDIPHVFEARLITLTVNSSLDAIGFLATVATGLAKANIPCNAIAAYHHDHLFVPRHVADDAMALLVSMASTRSSDDVPWGSNTDRPHSAEEPPGAREAR